MSALLSTSVAAPVRVKGVPKGIFTLFAGIITTGGLLPVVVITGQFFPLPVVV